MIGQTTWTKAGDGASRKAQLSDGWARGWSGFVLGYLLLAYYLLNYPLRSEFSADVTVYALRPAVWSGIGLVCFLLWRRLGERPFSERAFVFLSGLAGVFSIAVLLCAGILFGFGHSPYARGAVHMAQNTWYIAAMIFGFEMSRSYLMAVWGKINATLSFTAIALIFAALWFSPGQYENLTTGNQESLHLFGRTFMPGISESIMATFLVSVGGPLPAFIYHFSLEAFRWLSPVLPTLGWAEAAFIGTLTPAIGMLIIRDAYFNGIAEITEEEAEARRGGVSPLVLLAGGLFVAAVWLNTGLFGISPHLVSGPSMKPNLSPGDLVISRSVDVEDIRAGDIIQFDTPHGDVVHRVIRVQHSGQGPVFITKGDNNNTEDPPITASQVEGKVILDVPYVGWVPIKLKEVIAAW
jgi:signal peptidase